MKIKYLLVLILGAMLLVVGCSSNNTKLDPELSGEGMTIFKSATCGCCGIFGQQMDDKGYNVDIQISSDLDSVKKKYKIPAHLQSCHTSVIGDYFVEGHVPSEAIEKLIKEKPDIAGIAMPGMPSGSPGMPGAKSGPFVISAVHKDGSVTEFMRI